MNDIKTTEATDATEEHNTSPMWAFVNYALNKYMPLAAVCFISFYSLSFSTWEPYFIVGLMIFSNNFNFKCGFACSYLENLTSNITEDDE